MKYSFTYYYYFFLNVLWGLIIDLSVFQITLKIYQMIDNEEKYFCMGFTKLPIFIC